MAKPGGWFASFPTKEVTEEPLGIGAPLTVTISMLILDRPCLNGGYAQKITFEPIHRYVVGAAGRIDVYSYPAMREAILLRRVAVNGIGNLTIDEAENLVAKAPWRAYSSENLPLKVDLTDQSSVIEFLNDLVS
jgi:hypothetical protein